MKKITLLILNLIPVLLSAQSSKNGVIEGRIFNVQNNQPVEFASIVIWGTNIGTVSDMDGNFLFTGIEPGYVELRASSIGYEPYVSEQILVTNANKVYLEIGMSEATQMLDEVVIKVSAFRKTDESPVSLQRIGIAEIEKNPGGNRDISKVIQSFPGVASTPAFRNDVIVRGGGANENRFYLDGIEIPNLNHFSTQGASGGPVGIINVDFIREVNFYSGAFPASAGNALSSVLDFKQINGNQEKLAVRGSLGASDLALTLDGPLGDNTSYIFSVRRSYLQFLFSVLELPFLPTYNDYQFKVRHRFGDKRELSIISLGALDQFALNREANDTEYQRYILGYIPINNQWNYTIGGVYKTFHDNGFDTWVLSRNYLNNTSYKYLNNVETDENLIFNYASAEIENKLRYENNFRTTNDYKFNVGAGGEYAKYTNETFNKVFIDGAPETIDYNSFLEVFKWSIFGQVSRKYLEDRLALSLGVRSDANNYSDEMKNLLKQLSPRFSASYALTQNLYLNTNVGRYYQLPPYTTLGYRNLTGHLENKQNNLTYIQSDHLVAGIELLPNDNSKISIEGFYKDYSNYPFSINDSVSISSKSVSFGIFGDEPVTSTGEGRAYGVEVLYRNKDLFGVNLIVSYTLVNSEFEDINGNYLPSAWDNKHLLNITATREFKNNWYAGLKWRYVGGAPYTPYDEYTSSIKEAWDVRNQAYLDYSRFNQERFKGFHQLDVRVDKEFYFDKWSLIVYGDVQNLYNFKAEGQDILLVDQEKVDAGIMEDPTAGGLERYPMRYLPNDGEGTVLPTLGVIVKF